MLNENTGLKYLDMGSIILLDDDYNNLKKIQMEKLLVKNKKLETFLVSGYPFQPEGYRKFFENLKTNLSLKHLDISSKSKKILNSI